MNEQQCVTYVSGGGSYVRDYWKMLFARALSFLSVGQPTQLQSLLFITFCVPNPTTLTLTPL